MTWRKTLMHIALVAAYVVGVLTVGLTGWATIHTGDALESLKLAIETEGTAGVSSSATLMLGGEDGTGTVRRLLTNADGSITTAGGSSGFSTIEISQDSVANGSCDATPASQLTDAAKTCIFNQDTSSIVYCDDDASCTTSTGAMIEPRTGRCFETTAVIRCIADSGTPTVDVTEYSP